MSFNGLYVLAVRYKQNGIFHHFSSVYRYYILILYIIHIKIKLIPRSGSNLEAQ